MKVRLLWLLLFATALGASAACKTKSSAETMAEPAKKNREVAIELSPKALVAAHLVLGSAKTMPRRQVVTAAGTLDFTPNRVARIGPSASGRVASIAVVPGQRIKRGAVVASVDSVDAGRARADLLSARSKLAQADAELAREKRLTEGGASSERSLAAAQTERNLAEVELRASEARLQTLGGAAAGGALALVTPIDGTVLEVRARLGQPVAATDTLVLVGEVDSLWLKVDLYERDLGRVRVGDEVRITTLAFPDRIFEGHVDQLGTVVDTERHVLDARIILSNEGGLLRPGMTASARIWGSPREPRVQDTSNHGGNDGGVEGGAIASSETASVIAVARAAIQTIDGQPYVFVSKGEGKFELRAIERGADLETDVEIVRGLAVGEPVVIDGAFILKSELLKDQMGTND